SSTTWKVVQPFERVTLGVGQITSAAAAKNGTVVFSNITAPTRLWSFPLRKEGVRNAGVTMFPSNSGLDDFPSVSNTGKMSFLRQKSGQWDIWIRDLHSGHETWVARAASAGATPYEVSAVIEQNGSRVAYWNCPEYNACAIFTVAATGGTSEKLCDKCGLLRAWSSDGTVMASQSWAMERGTVVASRIEQIDALTGKTAVIAERPGVYLYSPDFSPD